MRCFIFAILSLGVSSQAVAQNTSCITPVGPSCNSRVPCDRPQPRDMPRPNPRSVPEQEQVELRETGGYVAPPRTGTARGPVNRIGIEGMAITLPEVRISTPRFEFPSWYRSRQDASMTLDRAEAPYVHTGYEVASVGRRVDSEVQAEEPVEAASRGVDDCESQLRALQEKYEQLQRDLEECLESQKARSKNEDGKSLRLPSKPVRPEPPADYGFQRSPGIREPSSYVDVRQFDEPKQMGIRSGPAVRVKLCPPPDEALPPVKPAAATVDEYSRQPIRPARPIREVEQASYLRSLPQQPVSQRMPQLKPQLMPQTRRLPSVESEQQFARDELQHGAPVVAIRGIVGR